MSSPADVEQLLVEGRYGRAAIALRRLEALIPGLDRTGGDETLLLALYGRALLLRQLGAGTQDATAACDVLKKAAHERQHELWAATASSLRARFRVDSGDIGGATADLAQADAALETEDLSSDTGYRLLDGVAVVYAGLRLNDRADEVRAKIEAMIGTRRPLDRAQHWATWSGELAARAMEPLAGGAQEPQQELMGRAAEIAAKLDDLPEEEVPAALRRGARGVRALSAAYRGRPSEALRLLGPDAFGAVGDLPPVERQIVSLAAMRAHALVGSLASARSLDDAATTAPATLPNLVLEVCRTRERLWLETYAGGDVIPVLHRMTELLVRLGWRGMDLVADTARQALEHQALRTESRTDALTGVGNRRALDEDMRRLLRQGPLPLALILVDIDHFKDVNDRFTHVVGDEVLRRVAGSLSLQLRTDDLLLRYGGDEFVVLLPGTGDEEANAVAERMAAAVASRAWRELADALLVTVTTGVSAVWTLSGRRPDADAEKLFRRADEQLLRAKRARGAGSRRGSAQADAGGPAPEPEPEPLTAAGSGRRAAGPPDAEPTPASRRDAGQHLSFESPVARARAREVSVSVGVPDLTVDLTPSTPATPTPAGANSAPEPASEPAPALTPEPEPAERRADKSWTRPPDGNRAAAPYPGDRRHRRTAFDPDPDLDFEDVVAAPESRDAHAHVSDGPENPGGHSGSGGPTRSRRQAREAGRPEIQPGTSAGRAAAEIEAAAREVAGLQAARDAAAKDAAARDAAAKKAAAARDAAARDAAEKARRQARIERERRRQERAEQERVEQERREAETRAADEIRREAYAREAAKARQIEEDRVAARQRDRARQAERERGHGRAETPAPMLRHAPLYDSTHYPDPTAPTLIGPTQTSPTQTSPTGPIPTGPSEGESDEPTDSPTSTGLRREAFGPPTSRQAIIDLSSRKRPPRRPYPR